MACCRFDAALLKEASPGLDDLLELVKELAHAIKPSPQQPALGAEKTATAARGNAFDMTRAVLGGQATRHKRAT